MTLKPLREKETDQRDLESDIFAGGLGLAAGFFGGAAALVPLNLDPTLNGNLLLFSIFMGTRAALSFSHNNTKKWQTEFLKAKEEEYLKKNPEASKIDAFEFAKKALQEVRKSMQEAQSSAPEIG